MMAVLWHPYCFFYLILKSEVSMYGVRFGADGP